ncbi:MULTISPECIES: aldose epimerase family protein [Bacillus]|uniref:Aldose epimerase n=2 Tax=Bacillus TaxID=1386 RepID=A0A0M5JGS7_9BACI|nr:MULTISPECIES: aldose epimerase [Bacillus]ALC82351.1 aldose epimerase [Bacillus gobiensis]MBP1081218.1 galactose mutarotase-like enzyme [Bacillus capparidis]MED1095898.1 aldose epimerase [Bacillus capparidis]
MYDVKQYKDENFTIYELIDSSTNARVKAAPERGGIIIGFEVEGKELLYLNKETFYNAEANVRGGIPILFPISGQLENGEYEWDGKTYKMKNHGVARNNSWKVIDTNSNGEAAITMRLTSTEETKNSFPFDFEVIFTYALKNNTLTIHQEYRNHSDSDMPIYAGFHPYFKTAQKELAYQTDAKTYLDYNDMKTKEINGTIDLTDKKEALALLDAEKKDIVFELPEIEKKVQLSYGSEFAYVVLWTEKENDFVCVEPWMAKTKELNNKEELLFISPGEALKTYLEITVE